MLIELAIGDAYGAGFEYAEPDFVHRNNKLKGYVQHPKHNIAPGNYTDDTQMSIANAEVICYQSIEREELADSYVKCFKRDPREGYAGRFYDFLCDVKDGKEFLAKIKPHSDKSGAAMRALPFGVFNNLSTVIDLTTLQAKITHDTRDGVDVAVAAALMSHYFIYQLGPKKDLGKFIEKHVPGDWHTRWTMPVGSKGWMSVHAAISTVIEYDDMSGILWRSVSYTGDVDTVAALALGAASLSKEVEQNLPKVLYDDLENGKYGRTYIEELDRRLMELVK